MMRAPGSRLQGLSDDDGASGVFDEDDARSRLVAEISRLDDEDDMMPVVGRLVERRRQRGSSTRYTPPMKHQHNLSEELIAPAALDVLLLSPQ